MRYFVPVALATALLVAAPAMVLRDGVHAQAVTEQAGHQYVVGVSGMS